MFSSSQEAALQKRHYIIGTAGHVDHGKTALVGALTGMDTDRLAEEKRRGLSIELGFAYCDTGDGNTAAFIDVPGHERFIRAMLSGVAGIDLALFCVAADDGVMPQTREHLDILHLLGVTRAVFVITKTDIATAGRVAEVRAQIRALTGGTRLDGASIVEVSVHKGEGIEALKARLSDECAAAPVRGSSGPLRLPVDRVFSVKGHGAVVTCTVVSGGLKVGDELSLFAAGDRQPRALRVRGIESHNKKAEAVVAGQRAALNLSGLSHKEIPRGAVLVSSEFSGRAVTKLDCVVDLPPSHKFTLKDRGRLKLYHQASHRDVTFQIKGGAGAAKAASSAGGPGRLYGRLHIAPALLALRGDLFILRDPSIGRTVGGGRVLMAYPSQSLTPALKGLELEALACGALVPHITRMVRRSGYLLQGADLAAILNMEAPELAALIKGSGTLGFFKDNIVVSGDLRRVEEAILEVVGSYHAAAPAEPGIRAEKIGAGGVKEAIGDGPAIAVVEGLLKDGLTGDMAERGLLERSGPFLALPTHRAELSGPDKELDSALMAFFSAGMRSARMVDLLELPFDSKDIERGLSAIVERGDAVKLKDRVYLGGAALAGARASVVALIRERGSVKVADMRDRLGCGRRLAIEILEYFDKERITLRKGDERVLR
ncbi:Selenocysteine-specific translation elongation factor [hydrothermal vent metagenome]|uniref:Selenocysteine-specific elongation factor n=1 Tax=hydrothermal vent metagenome TaxID=652676 RepID=A0A3B0VN12_9ZZZZ